MRILIGVLILTACGLGVYVLCFKPAEIQPTLAPLGNTPAITTIAAPTLPPPEKPPPPQEPKWPASNQEANATLDLGKGVEIRWSRGGQDLSGSLSEKETWSLETDFHIADVRKSTALDEAVVSGVDGLSTLHLNARTGKVLSLNRLGSPAEQAPSAELAALLTKAKSTYADALKQQRANELAASQVNVKSLFEISTQLSALGKQTEAFKVWTVAKKLQKVLNPLPSPVPVQPTTKPKPPDVWEDLEF